MSKKIKKEEYFEDVDKKGFMTKGFVLMDNELIREIIHYSDLQTAMVYMIILSHRNNDTNKCFPSIELLSRECGVSKSTIQKKLTILYEMGAIRINSGKQGINNNYYFPQEDFYDKQEDIKQIQAKRTKKPMKPKPKSKKNNVVYLVDNDGKQLNTSCPF